MSMDVFLKPLESAAQNSLMLGLFLPIQSGAWSPSTAPRGTSWTFDYNAHCTVLAEQLGFDLVFGLAQWLGKGGYGGKMQFRDKSTDPLFWKGLGWKRDREFVGHFITKIVLDRLETKHLKFAFLVTGHDIEPPTSTAHIVNSGSELREMQGMPAIKNVDG